MNNPKQLSSEALELREWLDRLRVELGRGMRRIGHREFAEVMDVSAGLTSNWANGQGEPSPDNYFKMALLASAPSTKEYFIVKALNSLPALTALIEVLTPEQKRNFCGMIGIDTMLPEAWRGEDRRRASGDSKRRRPVTMLNKRAHE